MSASCWGTHQTNTNDCSSLKVRPHKGYVLVGHTVVLILLVNGNHDGVINEETTGKPSKCPCPLLRHWIAIWVLFYIPYCLHYCSFCLLYFFFLHIAKLWYTKVFVYINIWRQFLHSMLSYCTSTPSLPHWPTLPDVHRSSDYTLPFGISHWRTFLCPLVLGDYLIW